MLPIHESSLGLPSWRKLLSLKPLPSLVTDTVCALRSPEASFTTLPALGVVGNFTIGVFGDLGDTYNSSTTLNHLQANSPQVILNVGDLVRACLMPPSCTAVIKPIELCLEI